VTAAVSDRPVGGEQVEERADAVSVLGGVAEQAVPVDGVPGSLILAECTTRERIIARKNTRNFSRAYIDG